MFNLFERKPKCYGDYNWKIKCDICKYVDKCIDCTNSHISGTKVRLTNKPAPPNPPRQSNK